MSCYVWPAFNDAHFSQLKTNFVRPLPPPTYTYTLSQSRYANQISQRLLLIHSVTAISLMLSREVGSFSISNIYLGTKISTFIACRRLFYVLAFLIGVSVFFLILFYFWELPKKPNQNIKCLAVKINMYI